MIRKIKCFILTLVLAIGISGINTGVYAASYIPTDYEISGSECFENELQAGIYLRDKLIKREADIYIKFISRNTPNTAINNVMRNAWMETGYDNQGDYLRYSLKDCQISYSYKKMSGTINGYLITAYYHMKYYSTYEQEKEIADKIDEAFEEFAFDETTTIYDKVNVIYRYICNNVEYDYTTEDDSKYSAYSAIIEGKSVCQGYSLVLYRMLLKAGVNCRVITSNELDHMWNIVKIGDCYYNVDVTWDDERYAVDGRFIYFLKGSAKFENHSPIDDEYESDEFKNDYPISSENYVHLAVNASTGTNVYPDKQTYKVIKWKNKPGKTTVTAPKKIKNKKIKLKLSCATKVTGYQIKYAGNKKFKNAKIKNTKKSTVKLKKIKYKKCFIKARAYTVVNGNKKYGKWSKYIKVKK